MNTYEEYYAAYRSQGYTHDKARAQAQFDSTYTPRNPPWVSRGYGNTSTIDKWKADGKPKQFAT